VDEHPKVETGDYLGDLTDELEEYSSGSYIEEFVTGGLKNYAFSVFCPSTGKCTTKCKVKGITLNYENSYVVNFTSLRNMILEDDKPLHVHNPRKIKRKHGVVLSEPEKKEYNVVLKKRRLMDDFVSFPYGYDQLIYFLFVFIYIYRYIYLGQRGMCNSFVYFVSRSNITKL